MTVIGHDGKKIAMSKEMALDFAASFTLVNNMPTKELFEMALDRLLTDFEKKIPAHIAKFRHTVYVARCGPKTVCTATPQSLHGTQKRHAVCTPNIQRFNAPLVLTLSVFRWPRSKGHRRIGFWDGVTAQMLWRGTMARRKQNNVA